MTQRLKFLRPATDASALPACPPDVRLLTLENGLTLIVREDHSAPVVSAQAWCRTGSIHEGAWIGAGLSHVLEHMLFKGTTTRPGCRIDQEVQEAGGYMNAYTSFDRTVYWINAPSSGTRTAVDILCDIMRNASLPEAELAKELDVIRREMDMNQDDPGRRASRRLFEVAYTVSPYRYTVIGYPDIFNDLKPGDIRGYYKSRYVPNNIAFVVVGDVRTDEVVDQIRAAYVDAKARSLPSPVLAEEPRQTAPREVTEEAAVELGHFHLAWHVPELRHPDVPLLDVAAVLLGVGRSSRLYRQIREKLGLVHYVEAWTYNPGNPGLIGISGIADAGKCEAARAAILAEVEGFLRRAPSRAELEKAVKQFTSGTLSARKTMQGQAQDLGGSWISTGDLNFSQRYLEAVTRAKPGDIQRVARAYLTAENRTVYTLLPQGTAPQAVVVATAAVQSGIQSVALGNGLRLLLKQDQRLPFVEIRAVFQGGVLAESTANNGISQVAARMLLKGAGRRNAEQIAAAVESAGGAIDSYSGNNSIGVNLEVLRQDTPLALEILADVLLRPRFPEPALEREKDVQLASIKSQRDDLLRSAFNLMRGLLFGESGYGLDGAGTETAVARIGRGDLCKFQQSLISPRNCVIAVYGDIRPSSIVAAIKKSLGKWQVPAALAANGFALQLRTPAPLKSQKRKIESRDKKQAVVVAGFHGVRLDNPDRYALDLIQEACSDLGSRLFLRIRDQLGLAYYVGAQNLAGLAPGFFTFYAGTDPAKVQVVEAELLKEVELLCAGGLAADELARAKAKIIGNHKIARQELGHLAMATALDELYGLGWANYQTEDAHFEAVTAEQIKAAAQKYLNPRRVAVVQLIGQDEPTQ